MLATSNFLIPNGTFIVELVAFLIVLGGRRQVHPAAAQQVLKERQDAIAGRAEAADEAKADAAAADDERRAALEDARQQAREIVEQAKRTAERLSDEAQTRGQSEYDRLVVQRRGRGRAWPASGPLEEAAQRLGELVVEVVERIIGREMDAAAHRDLIDEAVGALAADTGAGDAAAARADGREPAVQGYTAAVLEGVGPPS